LAGEVGEWLVVLGAWGVHELFEAKDGGALGDRVGVVEGAGGAEQGSCWLRGGVVGAVAESGCGCSGVAVGEEGGVVGEVLESAGGGGVFSEVAAYVGAGVVPWSGLPSSTNRLVMRRSMSCSVVIGDLLAEGVGDGLVVETEDGLDVDAGFHEVPGGFADGVADVAGGVGVVGAAQVGPDLALGEAAASGVGQGAEHLADPVGLGAVAGQVVVKDVAESGVAGVGWEVPLPARFADDGFVLGVECFDGESGVEEQAAGLAGGGLGGELAPPGGQLSLSLVST
jgi:hypothetical protein